MTLAALTLDVEDMLYGQTPTQRPDVDTVSTTVTDGSDTSWRFDQAGNQFWERGDYAEYDKLDGSAGEIIRFMADHSTAGADVTVLRAQRQTSALAGGYSTGALFIKNPPYTRTEIVKVIAEVIDSDMQNGIWYRTARTLAYSTGRNRYPANASDYKIEKMYQYDTASTSVGAVTFDFTDGASEDLWSSSSAHGLAVGDTVQFSAVGTGADEYGLGITYYVATIPTTTTFQLSATDSTTVLEGTADSVGTWTLFKQVFSHSEFPDAFYELITDQATTADSTGRSILVRRVVDPSDTIYYVARTRPSSSDIASLPTELANAVPYGVLSRLTGGTTVRSRYAPASQQSTVSYADAGWFRGEFNRMLDETRTRLLKELQPQKHWVMGPTFDSVSRSARE